MVEKHSEKFIQALINQSELLRDCEIIKEPRNTAGLQSIEFSDFYKQGRFNSLFNYHVEEAADKIDRYLEAECRRANKKSPRVVLFFAPDYTTATIQAVKLKRYGKEVTPRPDKYTIGKGDGAVTGKLYFGIVKK